LGADKQFSVMMFWSSDGPGMAAPPQQEAANLNGELPAAKRASKGRLVIDSRAALPRAKDSP
jgi:hypothetical protein